MVFSCFRLKVFSIFLYITQFLELLIYLFVFLPFSLFYFVNQVECLLLFIVIADQAAYYSVYYSHDLTNYFSVIQAVSDISMTHLQLTLQRLLLMELPSFSFLSQAAISFSFIFHQWHQRGPQLMIIYILYFLVFSQLFWLAQRLFLSLVALLMNVYLLIFQKCHLHLFIIFLLYFH